MSKKKKLVHETARSKWFYSKSRVSGYFKKTAGFEAWFYTGPSRDFGHYPSKKKGG